jgi:hypothetical protein
MPNNPDARRQQRQHQRQRGFGMAHVQSKPRSYSRFISKKKTAVFHERPGAAPEQQQVNQRRISANLPPFESNG